MTNTVREYQVQMRDGIELYTLVQLPKPEGAFPVIIMRTPYASNAVNFPALEAEDTHGYAIVIQHCRGTARSGGEFNGYLNERNDGLDLLDWIRQQPFYNGELFLWGSSYLASVHYSYLNTNPPDVKAAFLAVKDTERYNICYRNGFFKAGLHGKWVVEMHKRNQSIERNYTIDTFRTMPLAGVTKTIFGEYVPYIEETFLHPDPTDAYWQTPEGGSDYHDACNRCTIPILFVTSFYDIFTDGVFEMWRNLRPDRKRNCAFVVTPFEHSYNPAPENVSPEAQDFKPDGLLREVCPDIQYRWFDHFRKGTPLSFIEEGKTTYYRLWDHQWITVDKLVNAPVEKRWYLDADRRLVTEVPKPGEITFTYNPYNPAHFEGGVCNNFGGMKYQDAPNSRYDIISFLSEPLEEELVCEGQMEVELHCRSTAEDTCFYVRLDLVRDGKARALRDDIDSLCRLDTDYCPGDERVLRFRFAPHAFKLLPGDQLRLDVSSSCVPYFQVHTNIKGLQARQAVAKSCRNTIILASSFIQIFVKP